MCVHVTCILIINMLRVENNVQQYTKSMRHRYHMRILLFVNIIFKVICKLLILFMNNIYPFD